MLSSALQREHRHGVRLEGEVYEKFGLWAFVAIVLILLVLAFVDTSDGQALPTPGTCQQASKYCWCKRKATADDIRSDPERYRRTVDRYGDRDAAVECIEYVDTHQSRSEGRMCVVRRVCGGQS